MKKDWQKRFWKAGFSCRRDFKVDFDEFMLQSAFWWGIGTASIAIMNCFLPKTDDSVLRNIWFYLLFFAFGIAGSAFGYWIRNRNKN